MEVILFDNVKGLGRQGDLVRVAEGYFRNYLLPRKLAEEATPAAMQRYQNMKKKALELAAHKSSEARELADKLEAKPITIKAKAGAGEKLFGAVTTQDIANALAAAGFQVDKKQIDIPEPIKTVGEHTASVKIHPEVSGKVKLIVERLS